MALVMICDICGQPIDEKVSTYFHVRLQQWGPHPNESINSPLTEELADLTVHQEHLGLDPKKYLNSMLKAQPKGV